MGRLCSRHALRHRLARRFAFVEQQFAGAQWVVIETVALIEGANMHIANPCFAIGDSDIGVL